MTGRKTAWRLMGLTKTISRSGNPDEPFWYLGGPMTGLPQYNFPRFHEVGARLREAGYNIISPAEIDDDKTEAAALASPDGALERVNGEAYEDFLGRDLIICSLPTCLGGIFLEGWHTSRGGRGETWVLSFLGKETYEWSDDDPNLTLMIRDERLRQLGGDLEGVPQDAPGELTATKGQIPGQLSLTDLPELVPVAEGGRKEFV